MNGCRCPAWMALGLACLSIPFLGAGAPARAATFCEETAAAELAACKAGVKADHQVAVVKCAHLAGRGRRLACQELALEERRDGLAGCLEQAEAQVAVCTRLGGGRYHPEIDPADFVAGVDNPLFPLVPGRTLVYEGATDEGLERVEVGLTGNTKVILGVTCVEVRDTVTLDGVLVEDTLDWYAQDVTGNVWYFGELAMNYEDGELVDMDGSWTAGRDGALPGIVMKASPETGDFYRQEFLVAEAEDVARVVATGWTAVVPAGTFEDCLVTRDFSPLEPEVAEHKYYAPGVGLVLEVKVLGGSERLELVEVAGP